MAKKNKCPECPKGIPLWIQTFGDMMSLLLCFFVLLLSMSTLDAKKIQDVIGSLTGALSVLEGGAKTEVSKTIRQQTIPIEVQEETQHVVKRLSEVVSDINQMLKASGNPEITIKESEDGFIIRLPANLLFQSGSAEIKNEDAILFLKRIALIIRKLPDDLMINVQGHTDDLPPSSNSQYKDNWELSTARGISVAKELIQNEILPKRVIPSGRAMFDPLVSNSTDEGKAKNRRVDLQFFSLDKKTKEKAQNSILDNPSAVQGSK